MHVWNTFWKVSDWSHDGNTSSPTVNEVKHLELNQFSVGWYLLGSGECCCRALGSLKQIAILLSVRSWLSSLELHCGPTDKGKGNLSVLEKKTRREERISRKKERQKERKKGRKKEKRREVDLWPLRFLPQFPSLDFSSSFISSISLEQKPEEGKNYLRVRFLFFFFQDFFITYYRPGETFKHNFRSKMKWCSDKKRLKKLWAFHPFATRHWFQNFANSHLWRTLSDLRSFKISRITFLSYTKFAHLLILRL